MRLLDIHELIKSMDILKRDERAQFECNLTMACRELSNFQGGWIYCWEYDDLRGVWSVTNMITRTRLIEFNDASLDYWSVERIVEAISDAENIPDSISQIDQTSIAHAVLRHAAKAISAHFRGKYFEEITYNDMGVIYRIDETGGREDVFRAPVYEISKLTSKDIFDFVFMNFRPTSRLDRETEVEPNEELLNFLLGISEGSDA